MSRIRSRTTTTTWATWDVVLAVCAIASIVPLFCARHLPMSDLPEHLAAMATIRHYGDATWKSAEYFTVAGVLDTPYWLYHGIGALLTAVTGSAERANIVMLGAVGLAYPYALRSLLRALGRDPRLAIFGCALFWSNNLIVGILNFVASVPVVILAIAIMIHQAEKPTVKRGALLALLSIAIFYLHLSSFGLLALDALLVMLIIPRSSFGGESVKKLALALPLRLLWLAPSGVLGVVVFMRGHTIAGGTRTGSTAIWEPRVNLLGSMHAWMFDLFRSRVDDVLGTGLILLLAGLVAWMIAQKRTLKVGVDVDDDGSERRLTRLAYALAVSAFIVRLVVPSQVGSHAFLLDSRMTVFVALFAITIPRVLPSAQIIRQRRLSATIFASAAALSLGLSINTAHEVRAFETEEVAGFDDLLRAMPHGKRLVMLNFEPHSAHVNANVFGYFGSYYRARYGGVASFSFSETSHWPVQYRPGSGPPTPMAWGHPCVYRNRRDGAYFDYVMTRGERDPLSSMSVGPHWELVGASRTWRLFKKIDAGDDDASGGTEDVGPCG